MPLPALTASASSPELVSGVVSRVARAQTLEGVARALVESSLARLLSFDSLRLLLPAGPKADAFCPLRVVGAEAGAATEVRERLLRVPRSLFAQTLEGGSGVVLSGDEMDAASEVLGRGAGSALVLPLSNDAETFGALCFVSAERGAYAPGDAGGLAWLADVVAASAGGALCRERLEAGGETRRELERLKSGFVNTLVRDIRLPLTNVLGLLELFESKLQAREPFDLEDRQLLGGVIEQGRRMRQTADDLLEVARQQEQPLALNPEAVAAEALLAEAVEPLRGEAALRGVELSVRVARGTSALNVDARQTRRAVCHLVSVALASTPDGGRVQVEAQGITGTRLGDEGQRFVVVNVADSGPGIPPEEIPFVFDAFWHSAHPRHAGARAGAGLAIAKRVAAAHGGNVSVRSQLGAGTTYSLVLPAQNPARASAAPARHVLVVDDAPELLLLLGKLIERMGFRVTTAPSVARALETLGTQPVDLLLTDWAMPEANGGDLINSLRRDPRKRAIPVIVLTGHDTDVERREAARAGCDRFLVKPILRDELQRVITELLPVQQAAGEQ